MNDKDGLALARAIDAVEDFDMPGCDDETWGAEATRRLNAHLLQERTIIALGLEEKMSSIELEAWRDATLGRFIEAIAKRPGGTG